MNHPEIHSPLGTVTVACLTYLGFPQHRIASLFDVNQGRVSEALAEFKAEFDRR